MISETALTWFKEINGKRVCALYNRDWPECHLMIGAIDFSPLLRLANLPHCFYLLDHIKCDDEKGSVILHAMMIMRRGREDAILYVMKLRKSALKLVLLGISVRIMIRPPSRASSCTWVLDQTYSGCLIGTNYFWLWIYSVSARGCLSIN